MYDVSKFICAGTRFYLVGDEIVVDSCVPESHQLVMRAALGNLAVLESKDDVSVFDGGQPVCDDDRCATEASLQ